MSAKANGRAIARAAQRLLQAEQLLARTKKLANQAWLKAQALEADVEIARRIWTVASVEYEALECFGAERKKGQSLVTSTATKRGQR